MFAKTVVKTEDEFVIEFFSKSVDKFSHTFVAVGRREDRDADKYELVPVVKEFDANDTALDESDMLGANLVSNSVSVFDAAVVEMVSFISGDVSKWSDILLEI